MSKLLRQNVGGTDYTMVGCALTGVCASAADAFIKAVTLSDGDEISDGMTVIVTFANGNTVGTAPASKTIYSSDQVNYYEDSGLTVPFTLAPAGCYTITYTGTGNAYTYISYPVIQIGNVTGVICDASGNAVSGSLWAKGAQIGILFKDGKFLLVSGALLNNIAALPTDAVLHYSFDEVPDLPDGTADVRYLNGNTYGAGSAERISSVGTVTTDSFTQDGKIHKSNVNGNANYKTDTSSSRDIGIFFALNIYQGKVVIIDFFAETTNLDIKIYYKQNAIDSRTIIYPLGTSVALGKHRIALSVPANCAEYSLTFYSNNTVPNYTEWELMGYYVGDGSYSTPVIDNANGEHNGTNNGGLAVKGVSGKGVQLLKNKSYIDGLLPWKPHEKKVFTVSCWIKDWDRTSNLYLVNDWNTEQDHGNLCIVITGASSAYDALIDYPIETGIARYSINKNTIDWDSINSEGFLVIGVINGADTKFYVNGVSYPIVFRENEALSDSIMNRQNFQINKLFSTTADSNKCIIDDFQVFNRALSAAEVQALYLSRGNTPKYYPPVSIPASKIPLPPSTDGNYKLRCTVSDGVPSYSWGGTVKGETVRNLGGVQTYTITLPVNLSSSTNAYRVLKGCLCLGELETACFEITYGQRPNNNISVPNVSFMSSSLTMTYNQADRTITFSSTTKFFYTCIYSIQEIESYLGLPLTFA